MKVSVIIPVWNGREHLPGCLDALLAQDYPNFEIIAVDNASVDGSAELIAEKYPQVRLIRNICNLGFAGGCNVGLKAAQGDVLVLLNQDTVVLPGWLLALVEALQKPEVGIVGCKILYPDGKTIQHAGGWIEWPLGLAHHYGKGELDQGQWDQHREVEYVTGAAMAFRRHLIDQIGGMDEGFWPGYFEDADFCFRAREIGYKILYIHEAVVLHKETTSISDPFKLSCAYQKGRLRFVLKHMSPYQFLGEFVDAEKSYQMSALRGRENGPLQIAYLEAMRNAPIIAVTRWRAHVQIIKAVLFSLQDLFEHSMMESQRKLLEMIGQTELSRDEIRSLGSSFPGFPPLQEFQFRSSFPIIGPFISYLRRLFFSISSKWAIRYLIQQQEAINRQQEAINRQQEAINRFLIESIKLLYQQISVISPSDSDLHDH
jgi:Predicted glycosyltransferases